MLNNVVGYWAYIRGTYIRGGGLYSGGGAYIWNEASVSICGGLIHGGGLIFGGLIVGGLRYCLRTLLKYFNIISLKYTSNISHIY
jgi:hypothetical protein